MKTKWNYTECKKAAEKCLTRCEFWTKYSRAAKISKQKGWDNDFFYENRNKSANYWTKEMCINESKKYVYYSEFRDNSNTAYYKSKQNGWLSEMSWLCDNIKKFDILAKIHLVYGYFLNIGSEKYAYIGRTIQLKQRDYAHRKKTKKRDAIRDFCLENNIEIPQPIVLENNLTLVESQKQENYYVKYYSQLGYIILNIGKTGVGVGSVGMAGIKWDYDSCYEEALKYKTKIDFYKNSNVAWCKARKYDWLSDYTWLKSKQRNKHYWNYDTCMEVAKKCKIISELKKNYEEAYKLALKNNWLKDYTWFIELRHKHSEKELIEILKKCSNKKQFREQYPKYYNYMTNNKLYHLYEYMGN